MERLEGDRIHRMARRPEGVFSRDACAREGTDGANAASADLLTGSLEQNFDFSSLLADREAVQFSGEEALRELAMIDASWRMRTFETYAMRRSTA